MFFMISITEQRAREILKSADCCFGEDEVGDLDFLLDTIKSVFPNLAEEYSYLFKGASRNEKPLN